MLNLTTYGLWLIAGKRGIKNYQNMSTKKLLSTLDKSERKFKNILQNELKRIAKMQNHKVNFSKLQELRIYRKMNSRKLQKKDALKTTKKCQRKYY